MRFAIYCPIGVTTGGPEALHQLCHEIRSLGIEAFLLPMNECRERADSYKDYNAPIIERAQLKSTDILIVPEVKIEIPREIYDAVEGKVIVWWLSVDNSPWKVSTKYSQKFSSLNENYWPSLENTELSMRDRLYLFRKSRSTKKHDPNSVAIDLVSVPALAQSQYAMEFLERNHKGSRWLVSDYINTKFVREENFLGHPLSNLKQEKIISYNASKGGALCESLIEHLPEFVFVPIKKMTREQVSKLLSESILYLDLGHFPGRDRMPREAALRNTFVVLAKRGAAKYQEDFPLEDRFLLDLLTETPRTAAVKIRQIAQEAESKAYSQYALRAFVLGNRDIFSAEVRKFVSDLAKLESWRS